MEGFKFEHQLNYPLANATGYDVDSNLIAIRFIEQNKEYIKQYSQQIKVDNWKDFVIKCWKHIYKYTCSTQLNHNDLDMNIIGDALLLAIN
jgi:hypothetical protein